VGTGGGDNAGQKRAEIRPRRDGARSTGKKFLISYLGGDNNRVVAEKEGGESEKKKKKRTGVERGGNSLA